MKLIETPELVTWDKTHYVYMERIGPFEHTAPLVWMDVNKLVPILAESNEVTSYLAMFKVNEQLYRAGVSVSARPVNLPDGMTYAEFEGGNYNQFVVTGSYADLPRAWSRVMEIVEQHHIRLRDGFSIERYINDPKTTLGWRSAGGESPQEYAVTELLIPVP